MTPAQQAILERLRAQRGFHYAAYQPEVLERRLEAYLGPDAGAAGAAACLERLEGDPAEADRLVDALTISVSQFFRDPLSFETLAQWVLPSLLSRKQASGDLSLRIWSAGCATGEETYSLALLLREPLGEGTGSLVVSLFGSDIDPTALAVARQGRYREENVANVRHGLLARYFKREGDAFRISPALREWVQFVHHDLLDEAHPLPPESVFGHFDLVLCCNVLWYLNLVSQTAVIERLWRGLAPRGQLLLGRAERLPDACASRFLPANSLCPLYQKR